MILRMLCRNDKIDWKALQMVRQINHHVFEDEMAVNRLERDQRKDTSSTTTPTRASLYQSDRDDNSLHSMWQHFKRFCRCWYEHDRVGNTGKIRRTMDANGARDSGTETWQEISVCRLTSFPNRKKRLYAEERSVKEHVESICEKGKISRWHVKKRWNKLPSRVVFPQRVLSFSMLRWTETQGLPKICKDSCQWYGICFVGETRSWSLSIVE